MVGRVYVHQPPQVPTSTELELCDCGVGVKQDDGLTYTLYTGVKRELDGYEGRCGRDKETRTTKLLAERV